jgi:hypothetical protein
MSINNITGDKIQTKPSTKEFEEGWERVFGKKCIKEGKEEALKNAQEIKKSRIDIIGSNGNDGLHYITDNLPINEYPNNSNDEVSS